MMDEKQKNNIIGVAIMVAIFLGYSYYMQVKYPPPSGVQNTEQSSDLGALQQKEAADQGQLNPKTPSSGSGEPSEASMNEGVSVPKGAENSALNWQALPAESLVFQGKLSEFSLSQKTPNFSKVILNDYFSEKEQQNHVNLAFNGFTILGQVGDGFLYEEIQTKPLVAERSDASLIFSHLDGMYKVDDAFTPNNDNYGARFTSTFTNQGEVSADLVGAVAWTVDVPYTTSSGSSFLTGVVLHPRITYRVNEKTKFIDIEEVCADAQEERPTFKGVQLDFLGIDEHYFLRSLMPKNKTVNLTTYMKPLATGGGCRLTMVISQALGVIKPGASGSIEFDGYFGPKSSEILTAHDKNLYHTLDMGIFDFIAQPLYRVIIYFYGLVGNYGIAIIILTMILKILFYPLQRQATFSMQRMKVLQPQMNQLKERFKDDPRKQQQELMKFMVANKVNPMKGCLPVLPQIPVFFAFYRVLSTAIELRHAPFYGWIADLSVKDPYYVTPLFLGGLMFIQQKITPTTGMDKNQEKIMMFMPIIFTVMMLSLPSGMVIYMIVNTAISILQSYWLNKKFANSVTS